MGQDDLLLGDMEQEVKDHPLTTKGDLAVFGTEKTRLPVGTDGQVPVADSSEPTGIKWGPVTATDANATSIGGKPLDPTSLPTTEDKFGPELVTNGDFSDGTTGWTAASGATLSVLSGVLEVSILAGDAAGQATQACLTVGSLVNVALQARGDGANGMPAVDDAGGGDYWTGTTSTDWVDVDVDITPGNSTFRLKVVGDTSTADSAYFRLVSAREKRTVGSTNKLLEKLYYENYCLYSEDVTQAPSPWSRVNFVAQTGTDSENLWVFEPTATDAEHRYEQTINTTSGVVRTALIERVVAGEVDYAAISVGGGVYAFFDVANGVVGTCTALNCAIKKNVDGTYMCKMEYLTTASTMPYRVYAAETDNDFTFDGAGIDLAIRANGFGDYTGTIADNIQYIVTTNVANTGEVKFKEYVNKQAYWDAGFLQRVGSYDEKSGWEIPATGFEYWAIPSDGYSYKELIVQLFDIGASATGTLIASANYKEFVKVEGGTKYDAGTGLLLWNTYMSSTNYCALRAASSGDIAYERGTAVDGSTAHAKVFYTK